jgi:hypothetical protein
MKRLAILGTITLLMVSCNTVSSAERTQTAIAETETAIATLYAGSSAPTQETGLNELEPTPTPTTEKIIILLPNKADQTLTPEPTETSTPTLTPTPKVISTLTIYEIEQKWYMPIGVAYTHYQLQCETLADPNNYDDLSERAEINHMIEILSSFDGPQYPIFSLLVAQRCAYSGEFCEDIADACTEVRQYRDQVTEGANQDGLGAGTIQRLFEQFKVEYMQAKE